MLDIFDIVDGTVVFMPSGIQATLYNQGDKILVEYPDLITDEYSKEEFKELIEEGGLVVFNEPSQMVMESKDILDEANKSAEYKYVVRGQNGICEQFTTKEDAELYKQNLIDQGYSEYALSIDDINEEGSIFAAIKPKQYLPVEEKIMLLSKLSRIAKSNADVHTRQQATSFMNDLGMQYYDNIEEIRKFVKQNIRLHEEELVMKDNAFIADIAVDVEDGNKEGYEDNFFGNWKLTTSLDNIWEELTNNLKAFILNNISYKLVEGYPKYDNLLIEITKEDELSEEDLTSWNIWTNEEINEMLNDEHELQAWISYEVQYDEKLNECFEDLKPGTVVILNDRYNGRLSTIDDVSEEDGQVVYYCDTEEDGTQTRIIPQEIVDIAQDPIEEQFKLKNKKKKKLDELDKENNMNESYKVYNTIGGECVEQGDFNSWQEVEQYLNKEWGSYTNQMCKENPSFKQTEEGKLNFFATYDIVPITIDIEATPLGTNGTECPNCGCIDCICDDNAEDIEPQADVVNMIDEPKEQEPIEEEPIADEEPAEDICPECGKEPCECESEEDEDIDIDLDGIDELITQAESLLNESNPKKHDEAANGKEQKKNRKYQQQQIDMCQTETNEDFVDTMAAVTDIADADFPQAFQDTVPTKEDGTLFTIADLAKELKELKDSFAQQLADFKNDLKLTLQDVKQDLKTSVNDVQNNMKDTIGEIPDAIEDLTAEEMNDLENVEYTEPEEEEEEPAEEEKDEKDEEQVEEAYQELNGSAIVTLATGEQGEVVDINFAPDGSIKSYQVKIGSNEPKTVSPDDIKDVLQEQTIKEEKQVEEKEKHYSDLISQYTSKGFMEDLGALQNKIDKLVKDGASGEAIKSTIDLYADNDEEKQQAKDMAADEIAQNESVQSIKEALLATNFNSEIKSDAPTRGITTAPKKVK